MIRAVRCRSFLLCLGVIWAGYTAATQGRGDIPPIPRQERFSVQGGLSATLRIQTAQVRAGQLPALTLVLENTGTRTLRLPVGASSTVALAVHDASGARLQSDISCSTLRILLQHNSPQLLSRLSEHRSWFVRLTVAETVAVYDRKRAGRLMIRELGSRYVSACRDANARLGRLTRRNRTINCYSPAEREQAAAHWTRAIGELR
jgi:hypothetical protein